MKSNEPESEPDSLREVIAEHAKEAEGEASASADLSALLERIEKLELLIEQAGQNDKYLTDLSQYMRARRADIRQVARIRFWSVLFSLGICALLLAAFICALFFSGGAFWLLHSNVQVAFVASTVAGSLVLIVTLLKGGFRSLAERDSDIQLPESLRAMIDAGKDIGK